MASGLFAYVAVGVESSGGTASSSVNICDWLPFTSETLSETRNDLQSAALNGVPDVQNICTGPQTIGGGVSLEAQPISIGYGLRSFFDATSTSQGDGGASTWVSYAASHATIRVHQFIAKNTQFQAGSGSDVPTLTFHAYRGPSAGTGTDSAFAYYNMACTDFEMVFDTGQFITATFNYQGRASGYVVSTTTNIPAHVCWTWDAVSISMDGTGNSTIQNLTLRGNNNMEFARTLDTTINPSVLKRNGLRTFEISGNALFNNHTEYQRFKNGSEFPLVVQVTGPVITGTFRHNMQIRMPRVKYTAFTPNVNGPTFISVPFQGTAFYSTASATACEVLLVNTRTSDYRTNSNG